METKSLLIVLGSGGHTSEMLTLLQTMNTDRFCPRIYCAAESDTLSFAKVQNGIEKGQQEGKQFFTVPMTRSRAVNQSWFTSIFTTMAAIFYAFSLWWTYQPDVIICNGPGTCVPICIVSLLFRVYKRTKIMYIESITRVNELSLSGKILYRFCDRFIVQWPDLLDRHPNAEYLGKLM
ncbi:hypothetical protein HDU78_000927 [Chytriomyces hyalinus]|nr:hypothetical protein HDU78_000927 [Chytriomyces hyalinus]